MNRFVLAFCAGVVGTILGSLLIGLIGGWGDLWLIAVTELIPCFAIAVVATFVGRSLDQPIWPRGPGDRMLPYILLSAVLGTLGGNVNSVLISRAQLADRAAREPGAPEQPGFLFQVFNPWSAPSAHVSGRSGRSEMPWWLFCTAGFIVGVLGLIAAGRVCQTVHGESMIEVGTIEAPMVQAKDAQICARRTFESD